MKANRVRSLAAASVLSLASAGLRAENMPLAGELQGSVFKRIFSYDKQLRNTQKIVVLIVTPSKEDGLANELATAFRDIGLFPAIVEPAHLSDDLTATLGPSSAVVYVMPGVDRGQVKEFCARKGLLSISGLPSLAEEGHVSVSIEDKGDRPEIIVNMQRLRAEGHDISADLLRLARVIW